MIIKEGNIEIETNEKVFYNQEAELTRDISVCVLKVFSKNFKKLNILDAFSATGIRGLRYASEIKNTNVFLNDISKDAVKIIKKNILKNKLKNCKVFCSDARKIMLENKFDVIDIDPFGSPVEFLESSAKSINLNGLVAITATDTAALNGSAKLSGVRKYGIISEKTDFYTELGIRNLITSIILSFSKYEKIFIPIFSLADKQYYRVFGKISYKNSEISEILKQIKIFYYCKNCGNRSFINNICDVCGKSFISLGPTYLGKISDKFFSKKILNELKNKDYKLKEREIKILINSINEIDIPFYYDIHKIAKLNKINIHKIEKIIQELKNVGFLASRSVFCSTGIKTNAKLNELIKIMK
ncbi:MAG: tRNA (guanine(10)-N(2))-dimethyltransferase [Candidatus Aenigmarchaeota archaeon]|nr:tRNA (guanine(10)-N(2))-dimethyltransferase [Candidatus Aenigmarchaeota archaeon]